MPNTREKLIELFRAIAHENCFGSIYNIADYLIANGVTVQGDKDINVPTKWVSVKDRLPERGQIVLVCGSRKGIYTAEFRMDGKYPYFHKLNSKTHWCEPTHWMPLPEPPKGERNG